MVRLMPQRLSSHLSTRSNASTPGQSRSTSPMRSPDVRPLTLKVSALRGRNLAAKDRGGTSDPYLIVTLGDARQSTPTIPKTLNPEWNVTFEMPVVGVPLLECICWDHDRFGKDYLGEFDIALEDIFTNGDIQQQPKWYTLTSKRKSGKRKDSNVSGEILLQFSLCDSVDPAAPPTDIYYRFKTLVSSGDEDDYFPSVSSSAIIEETGERDDEETSDETDDPTKPEVVEKRRKRLRLKRLKRKSLAARAYQFSGVGNGVQGIVFMEIVKVTDLPPERNGMIAVDPVDLLKLIIPVTRTSFDMDPFVVTSLGRKTLRTPVIRHNLNPVYHEKMVFQVMKHEQMYTMSFTVMDRDKFSGNDFVASAGFPLQTLIQAAPETDPETGLYMLSEDETGSPAKSDTKISPAPSSTSLSKQANPLTRSRSSTASLSVQAQPEPPATPALILPDETTSSGLSDVSTAASPVKPIGYESDGLRLYKIPLTLKNKERWEDKHFPELIVKAKYLPYRALRQQFWRLMLRQYDADDSGSIDKVELTTMLDTLGSTLKESTIDSFFERFGEESGSNEPVCLSFDQVVVCLEDTLQSLQKNSRAMGKRLSPTTSTGSQESDGLSGDELNVETSSSLPTNADPQATSVPTIPTSEQIPTNDEELHPDDLGDERGEEHVIEIRECPLCHQPRLGKRSDADIITHIATCASQDWRQVDNLVMGGFVTSSQAQRKWYSKVITKISYGGYKLGANSANILVQDRITGQINEERMSVYVRLGIRLLYKGLKSRDMEKKRIRKILKSLSIKQGRKYDDPASAAQIRDFINFHQLDMAEVLLPLDQFKNFNEFFYRALKPDARPCSAPDEPGIVVSPADCRSVVFDRITEATGIWVKGREFSIKRLLGDAYPEDVSRYQNGALGVFRLAPQDYHRFHIPVDGVMGAPKTIEGEYYTVNPMAIRSALDVYGENVRILVPIDSVAHGRVMVVCVGAMMVGSTVITRQTGEKVSRAEELGYFKFGGSTLLVLFEEGKVNFDSDLVDNSKGALETLVRVGMSVGHSPDIPQFEPDLPKKAEEVSVEEMQAAKRRIEGSLAPPAHASGLQ